VQATLRPAPGRPGRFGFYARRSHEVTAADSCPVLSERLTGILDALGGVLDREPLPGVLALEVAAPSEEALVSLSMEGPPGRRTLARMEALRRAIVSRGSPWSSPGGKGATCRALSLPVLH
jgi:tRNA/tmRNA/rRNA uracil-C5-methylase (TrmA/RlmC/RlmD family)